MYLFSALRQLHQKEDDRKFKVEKLENQLKPNIWNRISVLKGGSLAEGALINPAGTPTSSHSMNTIMIPNGQVHLV